jgi:hypothetical protein
LLSKAVIGLAVALMVGVGGTMYFVYTAQNQLQQQNANLTAQLKALRGNLTQIQGQLSVLRSAYRSNIPMILLRTWGTALASYNTRSNGVNYLRLTETGPSSGVEAALALHAFNATATGATAEWSAVANVAATDSMHTVWPMVLENSPGGTNALEFEMMGTVQEVVAISNGNRNPVQVHWNATVPHVFKIVVVTPGKQVNFYIDGQAVATLTYDIPKVDFLLSAAEVKAAPTAPATVATLDLYGGLLSASP